MEVHYTNFEQDLLALNEHVMRRSPTWRRPFLIRWFGMPLIYFVMGLGLLAVSRLSEDAAMSIAGFMLILISPVWLVFYPWQYRVRVRRGVQRLLREGHNQGIYGHHRLVLTPTEVARYSRFGHAAIYWPAVERIEVGENHAFIFVSSMSAFIVPKRDFSSEQEFQSFVETARRYHHEAGNLPPSETPLGQHGQDA